MSAPDAKASKIAKLNDHFRETFIGGRVFFTPGISELSDEQRAAIVQKVTSFDDFSEANDPHGEHDFGAFDQPSVGKIFWKIDYYDRNLEMGSNDPSDPKQTCRVLTILLASEY